ncbi:winged helix-turn-helix domain-containing protein [Crossiella equi]|uniref:winged helix-turn-helix domain-containing protein n=1 Tax=Crossiella equi TaxID=130796 RepID=UPI0035571BF9
MTPDRRATRVAYQRIAAELRHDIITGRYKIGEKLLSYKEIARAEGVSVATVQAAIGVLVQEGYVETEPSLGAWVVQAGHQSTKDASRQAVAELEARLTFLESEVRTLRAAAESSARPRRRRGR